MQTINSGRRPADVWIPSGQEAKSQAWDFACSSGMRTDLLTARENTSVEVFAKYETYKRMYKNTDTLCNTAGFDFMPLIIESHGGGLRPAFRKILGKLDKDTVSVTGQPSGSVSLATAQRISCILHRENARAVVAREETLSSGGQKDTWASFAWQ